MKRIFPIPVFALLASLILVVATPLSAQKVKLRLNLEEGQSYSLSQMNKQKINMSIMGMDQNINQEIGYVYQQDVEKVEDGLYHVKVTYESITVKREGPQGNTDFDSERDSVAKDPEIQYMMALIGESFNMQLDDMGKVLKITGLDEILNKGLDAMEGIPDEAKKMVKESMVNQFGNDAMKKNMEQLSAIYPKGKVKPGKSWKQSREGSGVMSMEQENVYTLDKIEDGKAYIRLSSTVSPGEGEPVEMGPTKMTYELNGVQEGSIIVDIETGLTLEGTLDQTLGGTVTIDNPMMGEPMDAPMTIEGSMNYSSEKK
jgi:hypothetical protein